MSDDPANGPVDPAEAQFRRRARIAVIAVTLFLVAAEVLADIASNLAGIGSFHASEAIVGTLLGGGALMAIFTTSPKLRR